MSKINTKNILKKIFKGKKDNKVKKKVFKKKISKIKKTSKVKKTKKILKKELTKTNLYWILVIAFKSFKL